MFGEVKKSAMGKWSIVLSIITLLYFYYILRSAIIFHSPNEYEYLGKVVCTYSGEQMTTTGKWRIRPNYRSKVYKTSVCVNCSIREKCTLFHSFSVLLLLVSKV